jgi:hypothetical protein
MIVLQIQCDMVLRTICATEPHCARDSSFIDNFCSNKLGKCEATVAVTIKNGYPGEISQRKSHPQRQKLVPSKKVSGEAKTELISQLVAEIACTLRWNNDLL